MKKYFITGLLFILALSLGACGGQDTAEPDATESQAEVTIPEQTFTLDELAQYTGKDGMPAYVAIDGVVYDMSDVPAWAGGMHKGFQAGGDYSKEIAEKSPHGKSVLSKLTPVGILE